MTHAAGNPRLSRPFSGRMFVVAYTLYAALLATSYLLVIAPRLRITYTAEANEGIALAALLLAAWMPIIVMSLGHTSLVAVFVALQPLLFRFGFLFRAPVVPDVSPTNDPIMLGGLQLIQVAALLFAMWRWPVKDKQQLRLLWWDNLPAKGLWALLAGSVITNVIFHGPLLGFAVGVQAVIPPLVTFLLVARVPSESGDLLKLVAAAVSLCVLAFALNPTGAPQDVYYVAAVNTIRPTAASIGGHNLYGTVLVATVALVVFATTAIRSRMARMGLAGIAVLLGAEMLRTYSRGPILASGALLVLLLLYSRRDVGARWIGGAVGASALVFAGVLIRALTARDLPLGLALLDDDVNLGRTTASLRALEALLRFPYFLTGYGLGVTGVGDEVAVKGVHQAFLSTWVYAGFIGVAGLLAFFAGIAREAWKVSRTGGPLDRAWARAAVAFYFVWFIGFNSSGYNIVYGHSAAFCFFAVPAAALVARRVAASGRRVGATAPHRPTTLSGS